MSFCVNEAEPIGQFVSERNRVRQFDFILTSFVVSQHASGLDIDHEFVCTLNAYAARYLSKQPGRYRQHYNVKVGEHTPSDWSLVRGEMDAFLETLHNNWAAWTPVEAAAYALWGLNHIHPFCEGNGRTARALCYYVFCQKISQWLPGELTFLEMIRTDYRAEHCNVLQRMHEVRKRPAMETDLGELAALIEKLVVEQIRLHNEALAALNAANSPQMTATDAQPSPQTQL